MTRKASSARSAAARRTPGSTSASRAIVAARPALTRRTAPRLSDESTIGRSTAAKAVETTATHTPAARTRAGTSAWIWRAYPRLADLVRGPLQGTRRVPSAARRLVRKGGQGAVDILAGVVADLKDELAALRIERAPETSGSRWVAWVSALLLVGAAAQRLGLDVPGEGPVVEAAAAQERATGGAGGGGASVLNASGYVTARRRATVSSKVTGKVIEVNVEEGMAVREGQVLARLDDVHAARRAGAGRGAGSKPRAAPIPRERSAPGTRRSVTLQRRQQLRQGRPGRRRPTSTRRRPRSTRSRRASQSAQRAGRRSPSGRSRCSRPTLDNTVIRAPFSGVAISKDAQPGEMVSPVSAGGGFTRTGICTIVDMRSLEIEVDVNESYINRVTPEQRGHGGARRVSGLADSGARDHDRADGRSAEGDGARAHRLRRSSIRASCPTWASRSRSCARRTRRPRAAAQAGDARAEEPRSRPTAATAIVFVVQRRRGRAPRGARPAAPTAIASKCSPGLQRGERVVLSPPPDTRSRHGTPSSSSQVGACKCMADP